MQPNPGARFSPLRLKFFSFESLATRNARHLPNSGRFLVQILAARNDRAGECVPNCAHRSVPMGPDGPFPRPCNCICQLLEKAGTSQSVQPRSLSLGIHTRVKSGDTTSCRMTGVTLHGVVSPDLDRLNPFASSYRSVPMGPDGPFPRPSDAKGSLVRSRHHENTTTPATSC